MSYKDLFSTITLAEAADYAVTQLSAKAKKEERKADNKYSALIAKLDEFAKMLHSLEDNKENAWAGALSQKLFARSQDMFAENGLKSIIDEKPGSISAKFAISSLQAPPAPQDCKILRAISVNKEKMSQDLLPKFDDILNAFLATNKSGQPMITEAGTIYLADSNGKKQVNKKGEGIKANGDEVRKLISEGFTDFFEKIEEKVINSQLVNKGMVYQSGSIFLTENGEIQKDINGKPIQADANKVKESLSEEYQAYISNRGNKGIDVALYNYDQIQKAKEAQAQAQAPAGPKATVVTPTEVPQQAPVQPSIETTPSSGGGIK